MPPHAPLHKVPLHEIVPILERQTGIVLPVYFHPNSDLDTGAAFLRDTVYLLTREIDDPSTLCLSVDGPGPAIEIAQQIAGELNVQVIGSDRNRGKFAAIQQGIVHLLDNSHLRYFAAIDSDGDHFANELLNFIRAAEYVQRMTGRTRVLVLGDRISRHRPLGFVRGELEDLADRILLDALAYHGFRTDKPLDLRFACNLGSVPDFHSGFKVYTRPAAEDIVLPPPQYAGCNETAYYKHACEAVPIVEAMSRGALLTTVNRRAFDEQPISMFASLNRIQLHADLIIWPCKRLDIPPHFVRQWLDNHIPDLLLGTLVPQGRDELLAVRATVLKAFGYSPDEATADEITRPEFI